MLSKDEFYEKIYFQKTEELNIEGIYSSFFKYIIPRLENEKNYMAVIGNLDGSISRGINNNTSDIDMHLFGITDDMEITYELFAEPAILNECEYIYDLATHVIDITLKALTDYNMSDKNYPTVFFRTEEEKKMYSVENLHWNGRYRPDGEIYELSQLLLADTIFVNLKHVKLVNLERLYKEFRTIDLMDLQFVRAYGNYNSLMKDGQETVLIRKYIYTLYEIFCCNYIVERKAKPPQNFVELLEAQKLSEKVRNDILSLLELNNISKEHKSKAKCHRIDSINDYISTRLDQLKAELSVYDKYESFYSIMNSEKSQKPKIFYYE